MDYGYSTTSYGAAGGQDGGGFVPGSQNNVGESGGGGKRKFGTDTLRPVTIKQLIDAHHPSADAEHFIIDGTETTQITFIGQIRNVSTQTTNVTYKLDDGTGIIEVKMWKDMEAAGDGDGGVKGSGQLVEQAYARVFGRLKAFANKRHVGAQIIRPVKDLNEVQYHLLEATAVHLHFSRGPVEQANAGAKAQGGQQQGQNGQQVNGQQGQQHAIPAGLSVSARRVLQCIRDTPQVLEGMHMQQIANAIPMEMTEVQKAGDELQNMGVVYTTVDDHTWALLDV